MNARLLALTAACGIFAVAAPAIAQDPSLPAGGTPITITSVTQSLPTLAQYTAVELPIYKQVPTWSNGVVTFEPSTWAEYGVSGSDILRLVRQGQADIGASPLASVSGDVPFLEIADLAGLSPTVDLARQVSAAATVAANTELEGFGIKIIGTYPFPANVIFCRDPINQLSDLAGRKVRTFGPSQNDLVTKLGAQPVSVGFPEVYGALETGVADCAVTAALSANAAKWFEVTKYIYSAPVSWGTGGYYVNLDWWNGLTPEVRDFVAAVYKRIEDDQWTLAANGTSDGIACMSGDAANCKIGNVVPANQTMTVVEPTQADLATLQDVLKTTVVPAWIARCGGETCTARFNELVAPIVGFTAN